MKFPLLLTLATCASIAQAKVEFTGAGWEYGKSESEIIDTVGIATNDVGESTVVLNLNGTRQVRLSGTHAALGLALVNYQGKCIKIIPGRLFQSVNFILNCN